MRLSLTLAAVIITALFLPKPLPATEPRPADPKRPNVIFILADDLGYEGLACDGSTQYHTPVLDKMAAEGVRFTRCYVQPLCTPTRVQLMTGQYNIRNYIRFREIEPNQKTFAQLFRRAGYATAIAGKWQLGTDVELPKKLGFDESYLWQHTRTPPRYANPGLEINGVPKDFHNGEYGPTLVNDFCRDFVTRKKDVPFCLYYTLMLTHDPFQPTPDSKDWDPTTNTPQQQRNPKHFGDMVAYMDKMIGQLFVTLDELKLRDNTVVIFLGDNGTHPRITSQTIDGPIQGGKGKSTSAGMHVPLIVNWPGVSGKGLVKDDLVDSTDFLPTLLAAAGIQLPADWKIDGRSFLPQIKGEAGTPREWYYSWHNQNGGPTATKEFAADHDFKLYRTGEFFAYAKDLLEEKPLDVKSLNEAEKTTHAKLQKVLDEMADQRPAAIASQGGKPVKGDGE